MLYHLLVNAIVRVRSIVHFLNLFASKALLLLEVECALVDAAIKALGVALCVHLISLILTAHSFQLD